MLCELIADHPAFRSLASIEGIQVDLRYAGANNFVGRNLYRELNCSWLHQDAAAGLQAVVACLRLRHPGVCVLVLDALRPHRVQKMLWQALAGTQLRQYLADPEKGSIHSFGMAVDVTLVDHHGVELDMGTAFDELSELSHPQYEQRHLDGGLLSERQLVNRWLLRRAMLDNGFSGISTEWWHFDFGDRERVRKNHLRIE